MPGMAMSREDGVEARLLATSGGLGAVVGERDGEARRREDAAEAARRRHVVVDDQHLASAGWISGGRRGWIRGA